MEDDRTRAAEAGRRVGERVDRVFDALHAVAPLVREVLGDGPVPPRGTRDDRPCARRTHRRRQCRRRWRGRRVRARQPHRRAALARVVAPACGRRDRVQAPRVQSRVPARLRLHADALVRLRARRRPPRRSGAVPRHGRNGSQRDHALAARGHGGRDQCHRRGPAPRRARATVSGRAAARAHPDGPHERCRTRHRVPECRLPRRSTRGRPTVRILAPRGLRGSASPAVARRAAPTPPPFAPANKT